MAGFIPSGCPAIVFDSKGVSLVRGDGDRRHPPPQPYHNPRVVGLPIIGLFRHESPFLMSGFIRRFLAPCIANRSFKTGPVRQRTTSGPKSFY